ncbi:MAG: hypothetical protein V4590_12330 [Bacteroidota bacterium]
MKRFFCTLLLCASFKIHAQQHHANIGLSFQYGKQQQALSFILQKEVFIDNEKRVLGIVAGPQITLFHKPTSNIVWGNHITTTGNEYSVRASIDLILGLHLHLNQKLTLTGTFSLLGKAIGTGVSAIYPAELDSARQLVQTIKGGLDKAYYWDKEQLGGCSIVHYAFQYTITPKWKIEAGITRYQFNYIYSFYNPYRWANDKGVATENFNLYNAGISYHF